MNRVVLLDRDGVINQDSVEYIKSVDEFLPIPGSLEAIAKLTKAGFHIGVATNQSGISRGLYTVETLEAIHQKMCRLVIEAGGRIDAIEYCPHHPDVLCACRKPGSLMLTRLLERLNAKGPVPFVGDRVSDIKAALLAKVSPILVISPMTDLEMFTAFRDVPRFSSLKDWVDDFLKHHDE